MSAITITPCYEKLQLWCPYCKHHIGNGVRTAAITYTQNGKFIGRLLGELVITLCCKKEMHAPMFFETPTDQEAAVKNMSLLLEYSSFKRFRQMHILKRAPRRVRNSIRTKRHFNRYTFDDLLDLELQRKFGHNLMDFRKFPSEGVGNVFH